MFYGNGGRYDEEVDALKEWFIERLPAFGKIKLTPDEYSAGVDSLKSYHASLRDAACVEWLAMRNYELSYNQACLGFFMAAKELNLLEVAEASDTSDAAGAHTQQRRAK